jgi:thiol:disulfide interchange protein DsbD
MRWLCLLLLLLPHLGFAAASHTVSSAQGTVRLISAENAAQGGVLRLALEFSLAPGWHIYWKNPGDAGFPPQVSAQPPVTFGALEFPPPALLIQNNVGAYVLSGHVVLPFTARNVGSSVTARASWLVCADVCVPGRAIFSLPLAGGSSAEAALFTPSAIVPSPFAATLDPAGILHIAGPGPAQVRAARFFPYATDGIVNAAPQPLSFTATGMVLRLTLARRGTAALPGILQLTDPSGHTQALTLNPSLVPAAGHPPFWLLALLGGLILNLMPCVFPILAMKACAFARLGGAAHGHIRREALGYAAGVMASMFALAGLLLVLRAHGGVAFWGFQFQSPVFVAAIAWVIFAAALSLAGLFHVSAPGFLRHVPAQNSFFTGLLAVVLATPCTAPLMAPAVAAALALPVAAALDIFAALGLGLALPVLLLAFVPHLAAWLPRPGRWMLWLQRVLAVPMLGTFVWLAWVLFRQTGGMGLLLLLLGAGFLLLTLARKPVAGLAVLLLLPFLHAAPAAALTLPGAEPFSTARLAALRGEGRPVFIDLTAAWCVTCLVNEHSTLLSPQVQAAFAAHDVALLVGDWTERDPQITALLAANGRAGVPLYLFYPPGAEPETLPQILSPGEVAKLIAK